MLGEYLKQTSRLLRDTSYLMVSRDELTDYINEARRDVCRHTGCLRRLIAGNAPWGSGSTVGTALPGGATPGANDTSILTFATLAGIEKYHFDYARPYLQRQHRGCDRVYQLIEVGVQWGNPGAARPVMEWREWDELQALARVYSQNVFSYPALAALQGDGVDQQLFLFPPPSIVAEMEWDALCFPLSLQDLGSYEAIPSPYTGAVQYFAAKYAYLGSQRYGNADLMEQRGLYHLGIDAKASNSGKVPSYYVD